MLLALLHPALGLIFIVAIRGRTLVADPREQGLWMAGVGTFSAALYLLHVLPLLDAIDIVAGLGMGVVAFAWSLRRTRSWMGAILGGTAAQVVYAGLRRYLFAGYYQELVDTVHTAMSQALQQSAAQLTPENLQTLSDMVDTMARFLIRFQEAVWAVPMLLGLYLAALLLSGRVPFGWSHRTTRLPHGMVYPLIAGMAMVLIAATQTAGWNIVIILAWLYGLQGMMIIDFYWGKYFARSRVLTVILVLAIMLNYFILGLIMLMGLLDTWFNFRKLPDMEDNSGDHSHTGNL